MLYVLSNKSLHNIYESCRFLLQFNCYLQINWLAKKKIIYLNFEV